VSTENGMGEKLTFNCIGIGNKSMTL